jgi:hypothetical protein
MFQRITFYSLALVACMVGVFTLAIAANVVQALIAFLMFTIGTLLIDAVGPANGNRRTPGDLKRRAQ